MAVRIHLHPVMSCHAGSGEVVEASGKTVGECIDRLIARYPELKEMIFYKDGSLQTFIEIYVNRKTACPDELNHKVQDGDEIHLTVTIAGG